MKDGRRWKDCKVVSIFFSFHEIFTNFFNDIIKNNVKNTG